MESIGDPHYFPISRFKKKNDFYFFHRHSDLAAKEMLYPITSFFSN